MILDGGVNVSYQAIVRMLITEFDVQPLRADWQERPTESAAH